MTVTQKSLTDTHIYASGDISLVWWHINNSGDLPMFCCSAVDPWSISPHGTALPVERWGKRRPEEARKETSNTIFERFCVDVSSTIAGWCLFLCDALCGDTDADWFSFRLWSSRSFLQPHEASLTRRLSAASDVDSWNLDWLVCVCGWWGHLSSQAKHAKVKTTMKPNKGRFQSLDVDKPVV